jgi:TolB-like protein
MIKMTSLPSAIALSAALLLAGCQGAGSGYRQIEDDDIIKVVERAASRLMSDADSVDKQQRIVVTSFADVDDLTVSSRFGRMVAQQFAAELSDDGYKVVEILLGDTITIDKSQGEFLLSRDVSKLGEMHDAEAVVVGTYAVGIENVYVTAKIVSADDAVVIAARSFELNMGPDTRRMLQN